ncbi:ROK family protein [Salipiger marinus]|uniref:ROK family protein n=1 Tax=Salipiger marinus TaxID=555512 RepID=UPI001E5D94B1|nr:ROK family protein [Salipiger manganoxidans]MCD1619071.1 ROK family protein [Salipiger manganoxidans]MEB3420166.1 ROK family protein [Salipiger manganoxidans]
MTAAPVLSFDLGGTRMRAALVAGDGSVLAMAEGATPAREGVGAVLDGLCTLAAACLAQGPAPRAAGLCAPGPLDAARGVMLAPPTLQGWRNVPASALLGDRLGLPVLLENDANAAALGEQLFGAGQGARSLVFITVSTGIGGGVIVDGHILRGRGGLAGEIGHMKIAEHSPECACGARGCFEALASGSALGRRAAEQRRGAPDSAAPPTGRDVIEAARGGDRLALRLVAGHARWLGRGFANLLHLYAPDVLVMGGGLANGFDLLAPRIRAEIAQSAMPDYRDTPLLRAALGDAAGLVGMAHIVRQAAPDSGRERTHG